MKLALYSLCIEAVVQFYLMNLLLSLVLEPSRKEPWLRTLGGGCSVTMVGLTLWICVAASHKPLLLQRQTDPSGYIW